MNILGNRLKGKHNPTTQSLKGQKYMLDLQPKQKRINKNLKTLPIKTWFWASLTFSNFVVCFFLHIKWLTTPILGILH